MRLIDADKVLPLSDLSGCTYEGDEYQAYKSGAEYVRGLVDDTPTIDPESLRPSDRIRRLADILENEHRDRFITIDTLAYTLCRLADIVAKDEPAH